MSPFVIVLLILGTASLAFIGFLLFNIAHAGFKDGSTQGTLIGFVIVLGAIFAVGQVVGPILAR